MRFQNRKNHVIDVLFPIALFFVFAVSALTVILLAANIYRSVTESSSLNDTSRTSLSYISEKIRQNDNGRISLGTFDGQTALIIAGDYGEASYTTYIYAYEEELKELFIKDGTRASAADGKTIMKVSSFTMEETGDALYRFTCTDTSGQEAFLIASPRAGS